MRYRKGVDMAGRFLTLVLALAIGATPIAREVCEIACAEPASASSSPHVHHGAAHAMADHEMGQRDESMQPTPGHHHNAGVAVEQASTAAASCCTLTASVMPECGKTDLALTAAQATWKLSLATPTLVLRTMDADGPVGPVAPVLNHARFVRTPIPLSLRTPLRV
jgi:hypothetical protein